jgi:ribokinase
MKAPHTLIYGSYVQDLLFRVDKFAVEGQTVVGKFSAGPGGKGSNQAIACHRSGGSVLFKGAVGDDLYGQYAIDFYKKEGLPADFTVLSGHTTGVASITVNHQSQNQIVVSLGANGECQLEQAEFEEFLSRHPSLRLVAVQLETKFETLENLISTAHVRGVRVILNPAPVSDRLCMDILRKCFLITPNESEFVVMLRIIPEWSAIPHPQLDVLRTSPIAAAVERLKTYQSGEWLQIFDALQLSHVLVTLGSKGSVYFNKRSDSSLLIETGCIPVKAVDSTGAGDAFMGGLCTGIEKYHMQQNSDPECISRVLKYAAVTAGLSVTKSGAALSMPTEEEIKAALATAIEQHLVVVPRQ